MSCASFLKNRLFTEVVKLSFAYRFASQRISFRIFFFRDVKLDSLNSRLNLIGLEKIALSSGRWLELPGSSSAGSDVGLLRV